MDRVAVFVDAGYLFAQGSVLLHGKKLQRGEVALEPEKAIAAFEEFARRVSGVPLLRLYWYDGTSTGPTSQHIALAHLHGVKVRLGFVNSVGEQKGVDSLIVTDMINLARNRAMSDAVLLSGDEDIRVGVQQAQEFGVRVHLIGIKPSRGSQSLFLLQEADTCHEWQATDVASFLSCKPRVGTALMPDRAVAPRPSASISTTLAAVARRAAFDVPDAEVAGLVESMRGGGGIPRNLDARLLAGSRVVLKREIVSKEKQEIRRLFSEACEARVGAGDGA
ncbi:MAG: NYN domain-containing protein [Gemmatimonadales bacterium]